MTVARRVAPNFSAQLGSTYKGNIDAAFAVDARFGGWFAPHQTYAASPNPDLSVEVDAGFIWNGSTLTEVAAQIVTGFTVPSAGQHRVDRVVVDAVSGAATRVAGTPATGSPSAVAPTIPSGKIPIAQILITSADTSVLNSMITDERVPYAVSIGKQPTSQTLNSGSSATYTTPAGCTRIRVRMAAGGGSGSGATSATGGWAPGNAGGNSVFGGTTCTGGGAGGTVLPGPGGSAGAGTGDAGTTYFKRYAGQSGGSTVSPLALDLGAASGYGGGTIFSFGPQGRVTSGTGASALANTGCGSAGGYDSASTNFVSAPGGGGGEGVDFMIVGPAATYTYTVGAGGAVSAGTQTSGAAAAGCIIVEEFYD